MVSIYYMLFALFMFIFGLVVGQSLKQKIANDLKDEHENHTMIIQADLNSSMGKEITKIVTSTFKKADFEDPEGFYQK